MANFERRANNMPQILPEKKRPLTIEEMEQIRESLRRRMKLMDEISKKSSSSDYVYGETKVITKAPDGSFFKCVVTASEGTNGTTRRTIEVRSLTSLIQKFRNAV